MNWGWKIALVYTAFVVAIMTFVFKARSEKIDLVSKDYYEQELQFKDKMEASGNANELFSFISVKNEGGKIEIQLPQQQANRIQDAKVHFYCPSDGEKDVQLDLKLDETARQSILSNTLKQGNYLVKLQWKVDGKNFFIEKKLRVL